MKKFLLLMIAAFLAISLMAQSVNVKTQINANPKLQDLENFQAFLATGQVLDTTISETWDETSGAWIFSSRKRYAYSFNGNVTTVVSTNRDLTTGFIWVNSTKTETTVNANGKTTLNVSYTWNKTTSQWVGTLKMEFTFDVNSNMTSNSTYTWSTTTNQWVGLAKTEHTYIGGVLTMDIGYLWDKTLPVPTWVNSSKTEYTYTGGILTSELSYDWDKTLTIPGWVNSSRTVFTYSAGKMDSETSSDWDKNTSIWVNSTRTIYTYSNGNMTGNTISTWVSGQWVNSSKTEYAYDATARLTLYSSYGWDEIASDWFGFLKNEFTYGTLGPLSYTVTIGSGWDLINSQWVTISRSTSWYSGQTTGINKTSEKYMRVYPNPAKEFVVFDFDNISESARIELYEIQGNKVMQQQLSGNRQISVRTLRKGLYIYKLFDSGTVYTGKLVIE
jgi:hypothetical protein